MQMPIPMQNTGDNRDRADREGDVRPVKRVKFGKYYEDKIALWRAKRRAAKTRGEFVMESDGESSEEEEEDDEEEGSGSDDDSGSGSGSGSEEDEDEDDSSSDSEEDEDESSSDSEDDPLVELALGTTQNERGRIFVETLVGAGSAVSAGGSSNNGSAGGSSVGSVTPAQLMRYENYRRGNLNHGGVRKVCSSACGLPGSSMSSDHGKVLAAVAKMFVADVVTRAAALRAVDGGQESISGEDTPQLTPEHIRRAWGDIAREEGLSGVVGPGRVLQPWRSTNRRGHKGSLF